MNNLSIDRFLQATGGHAPIRIDVDANDGSPRRSYDFSQPFVLIGSHERADLVVPGPTVSRRQVYLQMLNRRLFATHLSMRVPTLWNRLYQKCGWVDRGTTLNIGSYTLRFPDALESSEFRTLPNDSPLAVHASNLPPLTLEMLNGRPGANRAIIKRTITLIGNDPVCKVRLNSSRVSAIHCCIVRTDNGTWVVDLASSEGVVVNDVTVRAARLEEGDLLRLGGRCLEVRYGEQPDMMESAPHSETEDAVSFHPTEIQLTRASTAPDEAQSSGKTRPGPQTASDVQIVEQLTAFQEQTFEQMREMMDVMLRAFGGMFVEHRGFVREEMDRLDQLVRDLAVRPPIATAWSASNRSARSDEAPSTRPAGSEEAQSSRSLELPRAAASPDLSVPLPPIAKSPTGEDVHVWLQQRIGELSDKRTSLWERMAARLRPKTPDGKVE